MNHRCCVSVVNRIWKYYGLRLFSLILVVFWFVRFTTELYRLDASRPWLEEVNTLQELKPILDHHSAALDALKKSRCWWGREWTRDSYGGLILSSDDCDYWDVKCPNYDAHSKCTACLVDWTTTPVDSYDQRWWLKGVRCSPCLLGFSLTLVVINVIVIGLGVWMSGSGSAHRHSMVVIKDGIEMLQIMWLMLTVDVGWSSFSTYFPCISSFRNWSLALLLTPFTTLILLVWCHFFLYQLRCGCRRTVGWRSCLRSLIEWNPGKDEFDDVHTRQRHEEAAESRLRLLRTWLMILSILYIPLSFSAIVFIPSANWTDLRTQYMTFFYDSSITPNSYLATVLSTLSYMVILTVLIPFPIVLLLLSCHSTCSSLTRHQRHSLLGTLLESLRSDAVLWEALLVMPTKFMMGALTAISQSFQNLTKTSTGSTVVSRPETSIAVWVMLFLTIGKALPILFEPYVITTVNYNNIYLLPPFILLFILANIIDADSRSLRGNLDAADEFRLRPSTRLVLELLVMLTLLSCIHIMAWQLNKVRHAVAQVSLSANYPEAKPVLPNRSPSPIELTTPVHDSATHRRHVIHTTISDGGSIEPNVLAESSESQPLTSSPGDNHDNEHRQVASSTHTSSVYSEPFDDHCPLPDLPLRVVWPEEDGGVPLLLHSFSVFLLVVTLPLFISFIILLRCGGRLNRYYAITCLLIWCVLNVITFIKLLWSILRLCARYLLLLFEFIRSSIGSYF